MKIYNQKIKILFIGLFSGVLMLSSCSGEVQTVDFPTRFLGEYESKDEQVQLVVGKKYYTIYTKHLRKSREISAYYEKGEYMRPTIDIKEIDGICENELHDGNCNALQFVWFDRCNFVTIVDPYVFGFGNFISVYKIK